MTRGQRLVPLLNEQGADTDETVARFDARADNHVIVAFLRNSHVLATKATRDLIVTGEHIELTVIHNQRRARNLSAILTRRNLDHACTSMSPLSRMSTLGIAVRTRTAWVSGSTRFEM